MTLPIPVATGGRLHPRLSIVGGPASVLTLEFDREPVRDHPLAGDTVNEVYFNSGKRLLQLTSFARGETLGVTMARSGTRAFLVASANLDGRNPTENCQLFSADVVSRRIRQLTSFREGPTSATGCSVGPKGSGCRVGTTVQEPRSGTLLFSSTCDPFAGNPNGDQIFSMRPDGSGLRQLTHLRGMVEAGDGSLTVELPGPWAYSTPGPDEGL